ncbi:hypothetical protein MKW94_021487 [Papaver nudicaule]|uniref:Fe2OG dioxygenase domain-containing protein n=1 Tax=Papaver nudicaule TaxID=74823 RepID=A0AA41SAN5_PAPNU|nr:hypothetical protein [Papaver nudicaule]
MDSDYDYENKVPCLDFTKGFEEGSEEWKNLCQQVRQVSEDYGCFQVLYANVVPPEQHEDMFTKMKELYDVPLELKKMNKNPRPYDGYIGRTPENLFYESMGIEYAERSDQVRNFTNLMWPAGGNPSFCESLDSMTKKMIGLEHLCLKMIFDSYGLKKYFKALVGKDKCINLVHLIRYEPLPTDEPKLGTPAHTDKGIITVLNTNIQGLEVFSKENKWIPVEPRKDTFTVFIGDSLKVWSNGRVHLSRHRVVLKEKNVKYTYVAFLAPTDDEVVEVAKEFIDEDGFHRYRPFKFMDFVRFSIADEHQGDPLQRFAGIVD